VKELRKALEITHKDKEQAISSQQYEYAAELRERELTCKRSWMKGK
jgi:hypothetical protein